ncbi:MAG: CHC2 zinc finger domain-containing protein, partial [Bacteroidota bacterium]
MIAQERIESAKAVSLVELIQSKGIAVEKRGHQYLAKCPFHEDHDPSFSIDTRTNLFKCFGCGAAGDAIRFIELYEKKSFPKAVASLAVVPEGQAPPRPRRRREPPAASSEVNSQEILNRVAEFYHAALLKEDAPRDYLAKRGLTDPELYRRFKLGYAGGGLLETLPQEGPIVEALKKIGILTEKGRELFSGCVTVPLLDADGNTVGMYGRRIDDAGKVHHLYLPGSRRGLVNRQAAATAETVILAESILDSLALIQNGFPNAIPLYGTNGCTSDHLALFHEHRPKRILLCLDNDEAGRKAAAEIAEKLTVQGFSVGIVNLTKAKDINEFFQAGGSAGEIARLIAAGREMDESDVTAEETELGLVVTCGDRQYRIRGIPSTCFDRLRVNIRATCGGRYHLDTLDLYQSKARRYFAASLAKRLEIDQAAADRDLLQLIDAVEAYQARNAAKEKEPERKAPVLTPEQEAEALGLLKDPQLIERILADLTALGHVGEETNKILAYLIAVSRKLQKPLSGIIVSGSGAGKSGLVETVQELVPPEDVEFFSRVTPQALYYMDRHALKRKLLIIEERTGGEGADYSIRTLQTRQKLTQAVPIKDPNTGKIRTMTFEVEGPIAYLETTTSPETNPENATRCF